MSIKHRIRNLEGREPSDRRPIKVVLHERSLTPEEIRARDRAPGSLTIDLTNGTPARVYEH